MASIVIRRLTPALLPDFLAFFDRDAFEDNPEWMGCYCVYYHSTDEEWGHTGQQKDDAAKAAIRLQHRRLAEGLVTAGGMSGFLAYADGKVAGWCNASRREAYQNARSYAVARDDTPAVGAVMCFVVASRHRRTGVASALLAAVCEAFAAEGLEYVEAYPSLEPGGPTPDAGIYHGPLDLYLKAGFDRIRDLEGFAVVRKRVPAAPKSRT